MLTSIRISEAEHRTRCARLAQRLTAQGLAGAVLFNSYYVLYYTGFAFTPTERPVAFLLSANGESGLFVPRLELEHAQANAVIGEVVSYPEYPCDPHPMTTLVDLMRKLGMAGKGERYGADGDGYPWVWGYRGPTLTELAGTAPASLVADIESQMMVKTTAEVALIREANRWGNLALTLLQRYTRPGATENEVSMRASMEATLAMFDAIGPIYRPQSPIYNGPSANYRGQIGRNSAIPHALANNITFRARRCSWRQRRLRRLGIQLRARTHVDPGRTVGGAAAPLRAYARVAGDRLRSAPSGGTLLRCGPCGPSLLSRAWARSLLEAPHRPCDRAAFS